MDVKELRARLLKRVDTLRNEIETAIDKYLEGKVEQTDISYISGWLMALLWVLKLLKEGEKE